MANKFPNVGKETYLQIQEDNKVPNKMNPKRLSPGHIIINLSKVKNKETVLKAAREGFPGGAVVGNLPAGAGDTGSSPGLGGSRMPRSGWAREPQLLSLRVWSLCSATGEAMMVRGPRTAMRSGPRLPRLERALARKRGPNTAINE